MQAKCSERAADVCIPASACSEDLSVLDKMLGASVLVSLGARLSRQGAGANTGQTSAALSERNASYQDPKFSGSCRQLPDSTLG